MPNKYIIMKRIFTFLILSLSVLITKAQISSFNVQGIDCNHATGYIALNSNSLLTQWEYNDLGVWISLPNSTYPSIILSNTDDTLFSDFCGEYRVMIWYNNGLNKDTVSFDISCPLTTDLTVTPLPCFGDSSGTMQINASGGSAFDPNNSVSNFGVFDGDEYYLYSWYSADDSLGTNLITLTDTASMIDSVSHGWYRTTIKDASGCKVVRDFSYYENPFPLLVSHLSTINNNCISDSLGSLSFAIQGGKKIDSLFNYLYYLVLANDTVAFSNSLGNSSNYLNTTVFSSLESLAYDSITFTGLSAGNYLLIIIDENGCSTQSFFPVMDPEPFLVYSSSVSPLICSSDSANFIIDSIVGGISITDYYYIGYGNDSIIAPEGIYFIHIVDSINSCSDTVAVSYSAAYDVLLSRSIFSVPCYGDSTGSIVIDSIYGGNAPYVVYWGGINPLGLSVGNYSVVIIDSLGCSLNHSFTVSQANQLLANPVTYAPSCSGDSDGRITIDVSGGNGFLTYYWLPGATGTLDSLSGLSVGTYSLIISDSIACLDTINIVLVEPDLLEMSFENYQSALLCHGAITTVEILVTGGVAPYAVLWNDGDTNVLRTIFAGSYNCVITDANGCVVSDSLIITEPIVFSITIPFNNPTCSVLGNADVVASGGTPPYRYNWSTGETTASITALTGMTYQVAVFDSCGFIISDSIVLVPFEFETDWYYNDTTHQAGVSVIGSSTNGPFSYTWTDIFGTVLGVDSILNNLCEGVYFVTTIDSQSNCIIVDTISASYYLPNGIIDLTITTVFADIDLWGAVSYTYLWSNGEISAHANLCKGSHWIEVTDNYGCMIRIDFEIDPLLISLDPTELIVECNLENLDVEITADATGGTSPYTYSWSNGSTENSINLGLSPGNYSVTIMDNNACIEDTSFVIATMSAECIPNVFTPNGDGINDGWNLESTFLFSDSRVRVFGRYGKLVFQSVGYNTPWNGETKSGKPVVSGSYFYTIEIGHEFDAISGSVTILR